MRKDRNMPFDEKFNTHKINTENYRSLKEAGQITLYRPPVCSLIVNEREDHRAFKYAAPHKYKLSFIKISTAVIACYALRLDEWILYFFLYAKYWCHMHGYLFGF